MRAPGNATGLIVALLALAGCGQRTVAGAEQIEDCERYLLDTLQSPSSYKRISASAMDSPLLTAAEYQARVGDPEPPLEQRLRIRGVLIEYDAENVFGAAIRQRYTCDFKISETQRLLEKVKPSEITRAMEAEDEEEFGEPRPYRPDCCLS